MGSPAQTNVNPKQALIRWTKARVDAGSSLLGAADVRGTHRI
jgi:hypothetical protein